MLGNLKKKGVIMVNNIGMIRKVCLGVAASGLVLASGLASAADFNATANVQNALTVDVVQDMSFGAVFAASANDQAITGLVLKPDGTYAASVEMLVATGASAGAGPTFFELGGETAARGSVTVGRGFTVTVPDYPSADLVASNAFDPTAGIPMTVNNDPAEAAFYLADFTVGDLVGGTAVVATGGNWTVTKDFGATEVEFGIGATIFTDGAGGVRTEYQAAVYSGTFEVTASY